MDHCVNSGGNGGAGACGLHAMQAQTLVDVRNSMMSVSGKVDILSLEVKGLRDTSYGVDGLGGMAGAINWLKGVTAVVCLLLAGILGFGVYNATMSNKHLARMEALHIKFDGHEEKPTHAATEDLDGIHQGMHMRMEWDGGGVR